MSINVNLGGDRIGSGNKMNVHLKGFERSTHDLSRVVRTTAAPGVLYPVFQEYGLNGDTFEININTLTRTLPTNAPLFGTFKMQLDVYKIPLRLYIADLKGNRLGVGMDMANVALPQLKLKAANLMRNKDVPIESRQFSQSSLNAYLGIRGIGNNDPNEQMWAEDKYNAVGHLAYLDVFKNYYANKQEDNAYVINTSVKEISNIIISRQGEHLQNESGNDMGFHSAEDIGDWLIIRIKGDRKGAENYITFEDDYSNKFNAAECYAKRSSKVVSDEGEPFTEVKLETLKNNTFTGRELTYVYAGTEASGLIELKSYKLENIDDIIQHVNRNDNVVFDEDYQYTKSPLLECVSTHNTGSSIGSNSQGVMQGLLVKTYQSDIFNNWVSTEWIDGDNGINAITSIDTTGGEFTVDSLILANKIRKMLMRIAVSGGTYEDWQEANWGEKVFGQAQTPVYVGGMSTEIVFEEVVSTAATEQEELGGLAGRGRESGKVKGGYVKIKIDEPSLIMGILSITPRLDYSQGNSWFTNLKNMDNFHKPGLDGIGFQDLITEQMAFWEQRREGDIKEYFSAGKQPSWINYQTSYNQNYGEFAESNKAMYMVLDRRYSHSEKAENDALVRITDLTTYIDPSKFNYVWSYANIDAQNFWVQIGFDVKARRKMSAKAIPNL